MRGNLNKKMVVDGKEYSMTKQIAANINSLLAPYLPTAVEVESKTSGMPTAGEIQLIEELSEMSQKQFGVWKKEYLSK